MKGIVEKELRRVQSQELTPVQQEILRLQRNLWDVKTDKEIDDLFDICAAQIGQTADLPDRVGTLMQAIVGANVDYEARGNIFREGTWEKVKALYLELLNGKAE